MTNPKDQNTAEFDQNPQEGKGKQSRGAFSIRRFSLASFLIAITLCCLAFGLWNRNVYQRNKAVQFLRANDVGLSYHGTFSFNHTPKLDVSDSLVNILGEDYFQRILLLTINEGDQKLEKDFWKKLGRAASKLPEVENLDIDSPYPHKSIRAAAKFANLKELLIEMKSDYPGYLEEVTKLHQLERLRIWGSGKGNPDADWHQLIKLKNAKLILIFNCEVSLEDAEFIRGRLPQTLVLVMNY